MMAIIVLGLVALALKLTQLAGTLLVDAIATPVAAWYRWRSDRLTAALLEMRAPCDADDLKSAWTSSRAHRRLLAKGLRVSVAMTAHYSRFPASSERGYAIARSVFK